MRRVLRVLRAEGRDGAGSFAGVVGQGGAAIAAEPGEVPPVLVPTVDEHADIVAALDVADAGERAWVGRLRLLVDRAVQDVVEEDEADRHEAGPAVLRDRAQRCGACRFDEGALGFAQRTPAGIIRRQTSPPNCFRSSGSIAANS